MSLGYEVLKEQQLFRKELKERIHWFIFLRWIAVGIAPVAGWAARYIGFRIPIGPLSCILFFVLLYNVVFLLVAGAFGKRQVTGGPAVRRFRSRSGLRRLGRPVRDFLFHGRGIEPPCAADAVSHRSRGYAPVSVELLYLQHRSVGGPGGS